MLIISKFHDYYDTAIGLGIDKTVVYQRLLDETPFEHSPPALAFSEHRVGRHHWRINMFQYEVGFCGAWYPLVEVTGSACGVAGEFRHVFYDAESLATFMRQMKIEDTPRRSRYGQSLRTDQGRDTYFKRHDDETLFRKHKCPVLIRQQATTWPFSIQTRHSRECKLNPRLVHWQFQKVKDAYAAFQDIYMYISGVLGVNTREIITLKDVDKIHKHGFDKFSFRKGRGT